MNESFCDVGNGVTLCYTTCGDSGAPPLLLIMGLGMQLVGWHEEFCTQLAERGFYVMRFDNRDVGRSTRFEGVGATRREIFTQKVKDPPYRLSDMASDAAGLLRELKLSPAHVVGVSMGGMIAQTLAAEHPESVRSLTSIMSTTGSRWRGRPKLRGLKVLFGRAPGTRDEFLDYSVTLFNTIGSRGFAIDDEWLRLSAGQTWDRGIDPLGTPRQLAAIIGSGNRTKQLRAITAPTLVIHGTKDPLVSPSGGRATAKAIPGARLVEVEGMGHDLPRDAWRQIVDAIASHAQAADAAREPALASAS